MSILHFFIIPEAILTVGIVLVAMLSLKKQKISESRVDIEIDSLKKEDILKLSTDELKKLRKVVAVASGTLFLVTLAIALISIILGEITILGLIICLIIQIVFVAICGIPFMKRIRAFRHAS
jgi:hypothetical protein